MHRIMSGIKRSDNEASFLRFPPPAAVLQSNLGKFCYILLPTLHDLPVACKISVFTLRLAIKYLPQVLREPVAPLSNADIVGKHGFYRFDLFGVKT